MTAPATTADRTAPRPWVTVALLTLALTPMPLIIHMWGTGGFDYGTILFPVDLALAALLLVGGPSFVHRLRSRQIGAGTTLWAALAAVMTLAWIAHPSLRGAHTVFELWGTAVLAVALGEAMLTQLPVVAVVAGLAVAETVWATLQLVTGGPIGLKRLGELSHPLYLFSRTVKAPMGSMMHIYVLTGFALIGAVVCAWRAVESDRPATWLVASAIAVVPVGFTFSRTGFLSFVLIVAALLGGAWWRADRRRRYLLAAAALCLGAAVPAAIWNAGWRNRGTQTTSAGTAASLTTDRTRLDHEAITQIRSFPVTGVGPGRYLASLKARYHVEPDRSVGIFKPVHDIPLLVTAEGGVLAGLVIVALFALVGWRAIRAGPIAVALYVAYLPFALLDHWAYTYYQGLVLTAVWLAVLDHLARRPASSTT